MVPIKLVHVTIIPKKNNTKNGSSYHKLVDVKRVNGKVVQKYVGYLGKSPNSKNEITGKDILLDVGMSDVEIKEILKNIGMDCDILPITKIVMENDGKLKNTFLRLK